MAAPVTPPSPAAGEPRTGPGSAGLWIGSGLIVVSVVGGLVWVVVMAVGLVNQFQGGPYAPFGSGGEVQLEARPYGVWLISMDNAEVPDDSEVTITSASGEALPLAPIPASVSGLSSQPALRPLGDVSVPASGTYRVTTAAAGASERDVRVVFSDPLDTVATDLTVRILGGATVAFLLFAIGLTITIVTALRRRNARRAARYVGWGYPPGQVPHPGPAPSAPPEPRDPWAAG